MSEEICVNSFLSPSLTVSFELPAAILSEEPKKDDEDNNDNEDDEKCLNKRHS